MPGAQRDEQTMEDEVSKHYKAGWAAYAIGWNYALSILPKERKACAEFMDGYTAAMDAE